MAWRGSFSVYSESIRCACGPWSFSCLISIAFVRWALVHGTIFLVRGVTLSMAGNARKGSHCIGIVFLCQKWRLWGLFFAGRDFAMKSMLPLIRQNVFLAVSHSPFLELLTLQKGPIAPFSATTPLFGRNETYRCLLTICGIGSKTASELVISIDIDDFPSHDGLASYCGLASRNRQSSTFVSASRQGNKRLKNLLHSRATAWRARMGLGRVLREVPRPGIKLVAQLAGACASLSEFRALSMN